MPLTPTHDAPSNENELKKLLAIDNKVKIAGIDVDGVLRAKVMSKDKFLSVVKNGGLAFCSILFGWDITDTVYVKELGICSRKHGYADLNAVVDLATFRRLPWEHNIPFFLVRFSDPASSSTPLVMDPRSIIQDVAKRAEAKGWQCMSGVELEYFQFAETPHSIVEKKYHNFTPITPGMHGYSMIRPVINADYFHGLYDSAAAFGIDVELHHTETGPGVYESALAYCEAARMADNVTLYKFVAKCVGIQHGIMPTFMAKPYTNQPGCSGHIHVSLRGSNGKNVFALSPSQIKAGGRQNAYSPDLKFISQEAEWFLAGLIEGIPDVMPLLCPTINSYKRLSAGATFWAPDTATYGYDSRNASVRVISPPGCPPEGTRFEVRIPGADVNPHFAISAIFALGMRGIEKQLTLPYGAVDSPGVTRDNVVHLPITLEDAVKAFRKPESIAREVLGDTFVDHIAGSRDNEIAAHRRAVTTWEVERYFELI